MGFHEIVITLLRALLALFMTHTDVSPRQRRSEALVGIAAPVGGSSASAGVVCSWSVPDDVRARVLGTARWWGPQRELGV